MTQYKRKISNLLPSTTYIARVRAYNGLGTPSEWSEAVRFTTGAALGPGTGDNSIPGVPSGLIIDYSSPTLILRWTANAFNADSTPLTDLLKYEISLTANSITVVYNSFTPSFSYGYDDNVKDFGTAQNVIQVSVRAIDIIGNKSAPLTGIATNGNPSDSPTPPDLSAAFTIISITMHTNNNADWGGYVLHHSTNGSSYSLLATLTDQDTYMHQVTAGTIHYYKYKIMDKFGNLSSNFSPAANITTHSALVIDNAEIIDNLYIKSSLVVKDSGYIESFNYSGSAGYHMTASKMTIQNGGIEILGMGGFLSLDSTSLRAVYSGNTQLLVNSSGVFIGGNDSTSAEIYVDTAAQITYIQGATAFRSSGGNYTFTIDLKNQTTGEKVLRLTDGSNVDTFYLTNDGEGYFAKGSINLGGSSALHVDNSGNLWLGNSSFGSAPFRVSAAGAVTATSGTFSGDVSIGSGNSIFKATASGIQLGHATFGSAPFRVDMAGNLTATAASITGAITGTSGSLSNMTISGALTMTSGSNSVVIAGASADIQYKISGSLVATNLALSPGVGWVSRTNNNGLYASLGIYCDDNDAPLIFTGLSVIRGTYASTSAPAISMRSANTASWSWDGVYLEFYVDTTMVFKIKGNAGLVFNNGT